VGRTATRPAEGEVDLGAAGARPGVVGARPGVDGSPEEDLGRLSSVRPTVDLTLVVPFYNPGVGLHDYLGRVLQVLDRTGITYEVLAVSDGSTDGSESAIADLLGDRCRLLALPNNAGKGHAVRTGFLVGAGTYLGFIDADGDLPADLLAQFVERAQSDRPEILLGSKRHPESVVHYPPARRFYSWGFQLLVLTLFRLHVRDTQTGVKLIRRDVLAAVLPLMREEGFAFDLELFVLARRYGFKRLVELPVVINQRFSSTVSARTAAQMLIDTFRIFTRCHVTRVYDRSGPSRPGTGTGS
jgi:glycosyltransferase involved in cell wall biosynthesis